MKPIAKETPNLQTKGVHARAHHLLGEENKESEYKSYSSGPEEAQHKKNGQVSRKTPLNEGLSIRIGPPQKSAPRRYWVQGRVEGRRGW